MLEYRMIQIPPTIAVDKKTNHDQIAAEYLQSIVEQNTHDGWTFFRVDSIGTAEQPGCFAALAGAKVQERIYYVITFVRQKNVPE